MRRYQISGKLDGVYQIQLASQGDGIDRRLRLSAELYIDNDNSWYMLWAVLVGPQAGGTRYEFDALSKAVRFFDSYGGKHLGNCGRTGRSAAVPNCKMDCNCWCHTMRKEKSHAG